MSTDDSDHGFQDDPHATLVDGAATIEMPRDDACIPAMPEDDGESTTTAEFFKPLEAHPTQVHPGALARGMIPQDRFPRGGDTLVLPPANEVDKVAIPVPTPGPSVRDNQAKTKPPRGILLLGVLTVLFLVVYLAGKILAGE